MNTKMRQLIIARKDLQMSPGKLAAQCCHASIAFLTRTLKESMKGAYYVAGAHNMEELLNLISNETEQVLYGVDKDIYDNWICDIFTKTICEAKNRNQLLKAVALAEELGLKENEDFFLIKDACLTELEPEEVDENGNGRVLTCIGFKPLPDNIIQKISKKYQLYR